MYVRLNINFDEYSGESQVSTEMVEALKILAEKKLLEDSEGAQIVDLKKYKLGPVIITKKDGTSLYFTRDLGAAIHRHNKHEFDALYYIVGSQQDLYFRQLFKTLSLMGFSWAENMHHINFGTVGGMSTRKGNVVFLKDILDETKEKMHDVMKQNEVKYAQIENPEEIADIIGMSAVIVQDMQARRVKDYEFNWNRMFSFEGDTGPYLQYAHARLYSLERNSEMDSSKLKLENVNLELLSEPQALDLISQLAQYPDILRQAMKGMEPCLVLKYLLHLCHAVSTAVEKLWVKGAEKDVAEARLFMYAAARTTLCNGMKLLGLQPVERM
jgi:arginyl-tRNA synthetase